MLPAIQKNIKYGYIRDSKLYLIITSTLNKYDQDNIINTIKMILNTQMIQKNENLFECIDTNIEDVIVKVDHKPAYRYKPYCTTVHNFQYLEQASGKIEIDIQDQKLHQLAQEIQNIIKENH